MAESAVYLCCWASTPYPFGVRPCHYLGTAEAVPEAGPFVLSRFRGVMGAGGLTAGMALGILLRDEEHQAGRGKGAKLLAAVAAHGIEWHHVRVWPGGGRETEAYLKDLNDRKVLCPECNVGTRAGMIIRPKRYRRTTLQKMAS